MSVAGIFSSILSNFTPSNVQSNTQNKFQQFQQEFQQLGQDLQSGNLTAAQSDFATLTQNGPQSNSTTQRQSPIAQAFSQLSSDLQSGNITAAQQDYTTIQQDFQNQAAQGTHRHHHRGGGGGNSNEISQLFSQLGSALQSGNITTAQQAYASLQQEFPQFGQNNGTQSQTSGQSGSNGVSLIV